LHDISLEKEFDQYLHKSHKDEAILIVIQAAPGKFLKEVNIGKGKIVRPSDG